MKNVDFKDYFEKHPDKDGYFGKYGGNFSPKELQQSLAEINQAY